MRAGSESAVRQRESDQRVTEHVAQFATMSSIPAYEREPERRELDVHVASTGSDEQGAFVTLDDTILYPEGGGQPADHGWLDEIFVTDVQHRDGQIRHYVEAPVSQGPKRLRLDWQRRVDHMQQHTAQHLITAIAADAFGWLTTSFHPGSETSDIEFDVDMLASTDLEALEDRVMEAVRAALPVTSRREAPEELDSLAVRTRGLPEGHVGDVRLVEIQGIDLNTCGGTHLASTAEIEAVKLLDTEPMRGGTRLVWIAGGRMRRRLAGHEERNRELRRVLETGDDQLVELAEARSAALKDAGRRLRSLQEQLAAELGAKLAGASGPVVDAHFDDADGSFLQLVGRRFAADSATGIALLTARSAGKLFFVVAGGPDSSIDLAAIGTAVAELLDGRGGGPPGLYQGKAKSLENLPDALRLLNAAAGGAR